MRGIAALAAVLAIATSASAQQSPESAALAAQVPIADVHFHLETRFVPADIKALLDRNNVRWAGGVGGIYRGATSDLRQGFVDVLGDRYIPALGQPEFAVIFMREGGARATENADLPSFRALLERAEAEFKAGTLKGFGELFVNNLTSNPDRAFTRKIAADAPTMRAMYQLAAKYGGYVAMHMEIEGESRQVEALASIEPRATVILSHCGVSADPATIRALMDKHPNIYCDLAWRAPPVARGMTGRIIFDESGARAEWLALIEDKSDRFMIGTDAYCCDYSQTIEVFRKGLLARLTPATLRKVAYENAQRVMKLK